MISRAMDTDDPSQMKIANKVINDRRTHAKRSAAAKSKPPLSERGEEAELDNGGSISAAEQPTPEDDNSEAVGLRPAPKPKAKRIPRQNLNATRGGRVAKATGQRGRKQASRGAGALAAATVTKFLALPSCQRSLHRWTQGGDCIKCFCVRCRLRSAILNTREPSRTCLRGW